MRLTPLFLLLGLMANLGSGCAQFSPYGPCGNPYGACVAAPGIPAGVERRQMRDMRKVNRIMNRMEQRANLWGGISGGGLGYSACCNDGMAMGGFDGGMVYGDVSAMGGMAMGSDCPSCQQGIPHGAQMIPHGHMSAPQIHSAEPTLTPHPQTQPTPSTPPATSASHAPHEYFNPSHVAPASASHPVHQQTLHVPGAIQAF